MPQSESLENSKHGGNSDMEISTIEKVTVTKKASGKVCTMILFKILSAIFNIIFIIVGIALLAVGIWIAVAKLYVSHVIDDDLFSAASFLLIAVGFIIVCICILGLLALLKEHKLSLTIYFGLLIFGFLALVTTATLGIVFKGEVENVMIKRMRNTLINGYDVDRVITEAWDQLQQEFECCALSQEPLGYDVLFSFPYKDNLNPINALEQARQDSWPIYKRTEFYNRQLKTPSSLKYVPPSCCVVDAKTKDYKNLKFCQSFSTGPPTNYETTFKNSYLFYDGCFEKAKNAVLSQSDIIVALGFVFAFLMIAGMVVTFFLLRSFADVNNGEVKRRREPDNL